MTPTVSETVPPLIEDVQNKRNPVAEYMNDILTVPASLAGLPAISVPFGVNSFPVQFMAPFGHDTQLLKAVKSLPNLDN